MLEKLVSSSALALLSSSITSAVLLSSTVMLFAAYMLRNQRPSGMGSDSKSSGNLKQKPSIIAWGFGRRRGRLPPGPQAWPLLGDIPTLAKFQKEYGVEAFTELARRYGGICMVRLGWPGQKMVVISDAEILKEAFMKQSHIFSDRKVDGLTAVSFPVEGSIAWQNGEPWKEHRRFIASTLRQLSMESMMSEECQHLCDFIDQLDGQPINPYQIVVCTASNIINASTLGKRFDYHDGKFIRLRHDSKEILDKLSNMSLLNLIPSLYYTRFCKDYRNAVENVTQFVQAEVMEHRRSFNNNVTHRDIIDYYIDVVNKSKKGHDSTSANHSKGVGRSHSNGVGNGHTSGVSNGHTSGVNRSHSNGVGNGHISGVGNGHSNGVSNGHSNGVGNGHSNGHAMANGHSVHRNEITNGHASNGAEIPSGFGSNGDSNSVSNGVNVRGKDKYSWQYINNEYIWRGVLDLVIAGVDTTSNLVLWTLLHLAYYHDLQEKVHAQIDDVVGRDRVPTVADRPNLPLLTAITQEVMRMRVGTTTVPHHTTEDTYLGEYFIPKGTQILGNIYGMHHDPSVFEDPYQFKPSRFLNEDGDLINTNDLKTFGIGPRRCPGELLAQKENFLVTAILLHRYRILFPEESDAHPRPSMDGRVQGMMLLPEPFNLRFVRR